MKETYVTDHLIMPLTSKRYNVPIKEGDIFKVATLNKFAEKYNYFKKCNTDISTRQAIGVFVILKLIDEVWYVYEFDKIKNTLSIAKKFRTLTELLQNKMFYGMFFYGNLFDGNFETDSKFPIDDKNIKHYKKLFKQL